MIPNSNYFYTRSERIGRMTVISWRIIKVLLCMVYLCYQFSWLLIQVFCTKNGLNCFMVENNSIFQVIFQAKLARVNFLVSQCYRDELLVTITLYDIGCPYRYDNPLRDELLQ